MTCVHHRTGDRRGLARLLAVAAGLAVLALTGCTSGPVATGTTPSAAVSSASSTSGQSSELSSAQSVAPEPCPTPLTPAAPVTCLADAAVAAVVARLAVMPEVAAAKAAQHLPVEDLAREREATAAFVAATAGRGVPKDVATRVIADQIDAAKQVQGNLIAAWDADDGTSPTAAPADLVTELRPRIDAATADLAAALALLVPGVPDGWQGALEQAQGNALPSLPDGVTAVDLAVALRTLRDPGRDEGVLQD